MDDTSVALKRRKLNVDDYYRMAEAGILGEDGRVEPIDGELIDMAPIGQDHVAAVNTLTRALILACGGRAIVSPRNPARLDWLNEPQPDFAVFRPRPDFYRTGNRPGPCRRSSPDRGGGSLQFDRVVKLRMYARAGIPEVWIIDLKRRMVDVQRGPAGDGYQETATHQPADTMALALAPDIKVPLDSVFG